MKRIAFFVLAVLAAGLIARTHAAEFNAVQPEQNSVTFTAKQMGVPVDGRFRKVNAAISFDPARPTTIRHRIIGVTMLMAFILYLDRICMGEIVKSMSFNNDLALSQEQIDKQFQTNVFGLMNVCRDAIVKALAG